MRWQRKRKYGDWLTVRMNSPGWSDLGDRLEILWGPDYLGRYDLFLFMDNGCRECFSEIPSDWAFPIMDKKEEIETFDVESGYRGIGVT